MEKFCGSCSSSEIVRLNTKLGKSGRDDLKQDRMKSYQIYIINGNGVSFPININRNALKIE